MVFFFVVFLGGWDAFGVERIAVYGSGGANWGGWYFLLLFFGGFFFLLFKDTHSQYMEVPSQIGTTAAGLHHSHNAGSELCLQPTPQLTATLKSLTH